MLQISSGGDLCIQDVPREPAGGPGGGAGLLCQLLVEISHHLRQAQGRGPAYFMREILPGCCEACILILDFLVGTFLSSL